MNTKDKIEIKHGEKWTFCLQNCLLFSYFININKTYTPNQLFKENISKKLSWKHIQKERTAASSKYSKKNKQDTARKNTHPALYNTFVCV